MSDLAPTLQEFIERIAESNGVPEGMLRKQFERNLGIDLTEVTDEDAETFIDSIESDEFDEACDVLREYGADDESIEMFRQQMEAVADSQEADSGNADSSEGSTSSGGSGGLSEAEIDEKIAKATPSASEIANEIKSNFGGGGGGGGGGGQPQEQQGNQMGQIMSLIQLMNDGGASSGLGQEFQEMAMKSFIADMRKPDLGDLLEKQYYEEVLGSEAVEDIYGDYMPDAPDGDGEEDDDVFAEFS